MVAVQKFLYSTATISHTFAVTNPIEGSYWIIDINSTKYFSAADEELSSAETSASGSFAVPLNGTYDLELHGGGGGGGGGFYQKHSLTEQEYIYFGSSGGGSGEIFRNINLNQSTVSYAIGSGGTAGYGHSAYNWSYYPNQDNSGNGGETSFGTYSVNGGVGGDSAVYYYDDRYEAPIKPAQRGGSGSGSIASSGTAGGEQVYSLNWRVGGSGGNALGKNKNEYGTGGLSFYRPITYTYSRWNSQSGVQGKNGAIIIVFKTQA